MLIAVAVYGSGAQKLSMSVRTLRNLKAFFLASSVAVLNKKTKSARTLHSVHEELIENSNLMCDFRLFVRHSWRFDNNSESIPYDTAKLYQIEVTTISHGDRLSFSAVDINS